MKSVTHCSGFKGTDPTGTCNSYKQFQKTLSSHTLHDVSPATSSLSHLPHFVVPTFGHLIITVWLSFWYHLWTMATSHPASRRCYLLTGRQILAVFSGLCGTAPLHAQTTETCHGESVPLSSSQKNLRTTISMKGNSMAEGKQSYTMLGNQNLFLLEDYYTSQ